MKRFGADAIYPVALSRLMDTLSQNLRRRVSCKQTSSHVLGGRGFSDRNNELTEAGASSKEALRRREEWQASDGAQWCRLRTLSCTSKVRVRAALAQGGNTCWLSSLLQLLFHSRSFAEWLQSRTCCCKSVACLDASVRSSLRRTRRMA